MKKEFKPLPFVLAAVIVTLLGAKTPVYAGISSSHGHQTGAIVEEIPAIEETSSPEADAVAPVEEIPATTVDGVDTPDPVSVVSYETPMLSTSPEADAVAPVEEIPATTVDGVDTPDPVSEVSYETPILSTSPEADVVAPVEEIPATTEEEKKIPHARSSISGPSLDMEGTVESVLEESTSSMPGLVFAVLAGVLFFLFLASRNRVVSVDSEGQEKITCFLFLKDACDYLKDIDYSENEYVMSYIRTIFQEEGKYLFAEDSSKKPICEDRYEASPSQIKIIEDTLGYAYPDVFSVTNETTPQSALL